MTHNNARYFLLGAIFGTLVMGIAALALIALETMS